jgi:hypothetical protein
MNAAHPRPAAIRSYAWGMGMGLPSRMPALSIAGPAARNDNDGIAGGTSRLAQGCYRLARAQREEGVQLQSSVNEEPSHTLGVADGEQDAINVTVAQLEAQPTNEALAIAWCRLGLDTKSPLLSSKQRVPGSLISWDWEGNLEIPGEAGMDHRAHITEELGVCVIADRSRPRVEPRRQIEPRHRSQAG